MADKKRNILIVMVDQLAPRFLPIHGHPLVRLPTSNPWRRPASS